MGLGVNYSFETGKDSEERVREWLAWDAENADPCTIHELWIRSSDCEKVGTRIVDLYPGRRFGAESQ